VSFLCIYHGVPVVCYFLSI